MSTLVCSTTANMDIPHVKLYLTLSGDNGDDKMRQNRKDVNFKAWDDLERKRLSFQELLGISRESGLEESFRSDLLFPSNFFFFIFLSPCNKNFISYFFHLPVDCFISGI